MKTGDCARLISGGSLGRANSAAHRRACLW